MFYTCLQIKFSMKHFSSGLGWRRLSLLVCVLLGGMAAVEAQVAPAREVYQQTNLGNNRVQLRMDPQRIQFAFDSLFILSDSTLDTFEALDMSLSLDSTIELGGGVGSNWSTMALGPGAQASYFGSKALGSGSTALWEDAIAAGRDATANKWAAVALGNNATASGVSSLASGSGSTASQWASMALGAGSTATRAGAFASGINADATDWSAIAMGHNATASAANSIALGWNSTASATNAMAFGEGSTASDWHALATGHQSSASETHAVATGRSTVASGNHSVAFGDDANATGDHSRAFGVGSTASATHAHAFGRNSTASGGNSYSLGYYTVASGWSSLALGQRSIASGDFALALGDSTVASGYNSAALGTFSRATGHSSIAGAGRSEARSFHEVQFGAFVDVAGLGSATRGAMIPEEALFVIGNGTSEVNRSNALVIRKDGTATFHDSLSVLGEADFASGLTVGDTLRVQAPALFADSVDVVGNTRIGGDLNVAGDLYVGGVQVVPGGGDTTAIWLGKMTTNVIMPGPTILLMNLVDEEDDADVFTATPGAVVVSVPGIYEIQTMMLAEYYHSSNDGYLVSSVYVNSSEALPCVAFATYGPSSMGLVATARATCRLRLNAGDSISLMAIELGGGTSEIQFATLNVEKVD